VWVFHDVCVFLWVVCYGVLCDPVCMVCYGRVKKFKKFWLFRAFCVVVGYLQCYANSMRLLASFVLITHIQADTSANAIQT
jgi:hypothetical protein